MQITRIKSDQEPLGQGVNDPPVIDYIKPTKMFQEPGRRLYVWETWRPDLASREYRTTTELQTLPRGCVERMSPLELGDPGALVGYQVYGAHFLPESGVDCAFFADANTSGLQWNWSTSYGHSMDKPVPALNINSSLVICPLPQEPALKGGKYQSWRHCMSHSLGAEFRSAQSASVEDGDLEPTKVLFLACLESEWKRNRLQKSLKEPIFVQVILDGVTAPAAQLNGSFTSQAASPSSQHPGAEEHLPLLVSPAVAARVLFCTDAEGAKYTGKLLLSTDAGRLYYPIDLDLKFEADPFALPLPIGKLSKVFAGAILEVTALDVQASARCQFRAYGSNGRLLLDAQRIGARCGPSSIPSVNGSNETEEEMEGINGTIPAHTAEPCPRIIDDYMTVPELAVSVTEADVTGEELRAGFHGTSRVRCRIPDSLSLGVWQVGLLNYDSLFVVAQNFVSFQVLQKSIVGRVSPNATALGSNTPLVLYGGPLGSLLRETEGSRCIFQPDGFDGEAESTPWILDSQRVACFPPAIAGLPGGRKVKITLRIHGTSMPSEASFLLYPQRELFTVPFGGQSNSTIVQVKVGLVGEEPQMPVFPVKLLAQNTQFQGPAQVKLWVTPMSYSRPSSGSGLSLVEIPLTELSLLLGAPVVDYSVTFPPGIVFSTYFIDPDEDAASSLGLSVRGVATVEVSPSMLLSPPKITAVYPRMVPWIDRSRRVIDNDEDPSLLVVGLGFVNTNRLRCQLIDTFGHVVAAPYAMYISSTQVRCGLPPFELPGSSNVKLQVSNDGAEWSQEIFEVYIVSALELRQVTLAPSFGVPTGNAVQVTTASSLPRVATLGCLFGLGTESRSEAIFLSSNDVLCVADQPVKSFSLRRAGSADPGGNSPEIGFRLTLAPISGRTGDPRLLTSAATSFMYTRTPSFNRLVPNFGSLNLPLTVKGRNFPMGIANASQVQCFWSLTRVVTAGILLSDTELRCFSPNQLPIIQLTGPLGSVDHLSSISFDNGRNFHPVAAEGLAFTILHRGSGPLAALLAPTSVLVGRGETISLYGGDFMALRQLAPAFGYCTFSWLDVPESRRRRSRRPAARSTPTDAETEKNRSTSHSEKSSAKCAGRNRRVQSSEVPLDLPPATHAVQLFFTQGSSTFEARYGIPPGEPWLNLTVALWTCERGSQVFPSFAIYDLEPAWAPRGGFWQISVKGSRILPLEDRWVAWVRRVTNVPLAMRRPRLPYESLCMSGMARSRSPKEQKNGSGASQAAECSGMSLEGRRALVTGGSKGIGRATAELLLKLGAEDREWFFHLWVCPVFGQTWLLHVTPACGRNRHGLRCPATRPPWQVAICARGDSELQAVRTSSGAAERCHAIVADLSTEEGVKELSKGPCTGRWCVEDLMAKLPWKELDILVNNCGTNIRKRAEDFEPEEFRKIFDTNFMSSMWLSRAALPLLKSAAEKGKPGGAAVVNISSVAGRTHIPSGFPYAASKAAMDQMTRNLAVEWARFGIRVNAVAPGVIETPLIKTASPIYVADFKERKPLSRMGQVNEIARPIAFLASESASFITGQILVVDGGFTATCFNKVPSYWEDQ
ncbi:unnamed protein product [Durusdinium trenchii]|uniref:Uncharacterized protein n=1 Tax=Durusdinium trenchii TaxID=1381693 RepID=A0ABP0RLE9_9DINO